MFFILGLTELMACSPSHFTDADFTPIQKPITTLPLTLSLTVPSTEIPKTTTMASLEIPATEDRKKTETKPFEPLAWEADPQLRAKTALWSQLVYKIIEKQTPEILGQNVADDVELFCPRYRSLNEAQRINFWAQLIVGISKFESGWVPTAMAIEHGMNGVDSVTGKHIASEGLLQISYQDEKNYPIKCGFDWPKDRKLSSNDPRKTIFDPYLNLNCGLQILSYQLKRFQTIVVTESRQLYWAVLYKGQFNKIKEISEITKSLTFCK